MDKIVAVICLIVAVVMIVFIEIYLKLDKQKTVALHFLKEMENGMDSWVNDGAVLADRIPENSEKFKSAILAYRNVQPKMKYKKVEQLNQIHKYVTAAVADGVNDVEVKAIGRGLTATFMTFCMLQAEYNTTVLKLNSMMNFKIIAFVGKIVRIPHMEKMNQLTIL